MKTNKLLEIAEKHHFSTDFVNEVVDYKPSGETINIQHKVWMFTEDQLKKFVREIEKETKRIIA